MDVWTFTGERKGNMHFMVESDSDQIEEQFICKGANIKHDRLQKTKGSE